MKLGIELTDSLRYVLADLENNIHISKSESFTGSGVRFDRIFSGKTKTVSEDFLAKIYFEFSKLDWIQMLKLLSCYEASIIPEDRGEIWYLNLWNCVDVTQYKVMGSLIEKYLGIADGSINVNGEIINFIKV